MRVFSPSFWIQAFTSTLITMLMMYLIKKITAKVNVPVISDIAQEV